MNNNNNNNFFIQAKQIILPDGKILDATKTQDQLLCLKIEKDKISYIGEWKKRISFIK
jgi:hypothetical protein